MQIDVTAEEAKYILSLIDILGEGDYDEGKTVTEKIKNAQQALEAFKQEAKHKWEGEKCSGCKHLHTSHSAGKGMCCFANCDCWEFKPSGVIV